MSVEITNAVAADAPQPIRAETVIVLPCFNEEQRLQPQIFLDFLRREPQIALLFIDDGSSDGTQQLLQELKQAAPSNRVDVVSLPRNQGKAEAVRQGLLRALAAKPVFVGYWDADLATPLAVSAHFRQLLTQNSNLNLVMGSRVQLLGRTIDRKIWRHYTGRVFATLVSLMLKLRVYDTQCGAKLFRASAELAKILELPFLARWVFDVEILARMQHEHRRTGGQPLEQRVFEYPLEYWRDVEGSKLRTGDFFIAFRDLIQIYLRYVD